MAKSKYQCVIRTDSTQLHKNSRIMVEIFKSSRDSTGIDDIKANIVLITEISLKNLDDLTNIIYVGASRARGLPMLAINNDISETSTAKAKRVIKKCLCVSVCA